MPSTVALLSQPSLSSDRCPHHWVSWGSWAGGHLPASDPGKVGPLEGPSPSRAAHGVLGQGAGGMTCEQTAHWAVRIQGRECACSLRQPAQQCRGPHESQTPLQPAPLNVPPPPAAGRPSARRGSAPHFRAWGRVPLLRTAGVGHLPTSLPPRGFLRQRPPPPSACPESPPPCCRRAAEGSSPIPSRLLLSPTWSEREDSW